MSFTAPLLYVFLMGEKHATHCLLKLKSLLWLSYVDYATHLNPLETTNMGIWRGSMDRSIGLDKPHPGRLEVGRVHIVSNARGLPEMTVGRVHTLASGHTLSQQWFQSQ